MNSSARGQEHVPLQASQLVLVKPAPKALRETPLLLLLRGVLHIKIEFRYDARTPKGDVRNYTQDGTNRPDATEEFRSFQN